MTENQTPSPKTPSRAARSAAAAATPGLPDTKSAATAAKAATAKAAAAKAAAAKSAAAPAKSAPALRKSLPAGRTKAVAVTLAPKAAIEPAYRHPNLGLAPADMTAGSVAAADRIRAAADRISAAAIETAVHTDPSIRTRNDEVTLRKLMRDGDLLVERLAMCLASGKTLWLTEFAEWLGPIYRRRGMSQGDLATFCVGIRAAVEPLLSPDEQLVAAGSLDAAAAIFTRNGRVGGDRHKRNAFLKWMYRGV